MFPAGGACHTIGVGQQWPKSIYTDRHEVMVSIDLETIVGVDTLLYIEQITFFG